MRDHDPDEETIASLLHTIALIREAAGCGGEVTLMELPAFVERVRAERDEARREVCLLRAPSTQPSSIASYAIERGWDCFDTPHTNATDVRVQNGGE